MSPEDLIALEIGRLVLGLATAMRPVTIFNQGEDGVFVVVGLDRQRSDGDTLATALDLAARRVGIVPRAKCLRPELPTLPDSIEALRGKP